MWVDGRIYYGMWKDGHQHGEGTLVLPNMGMKKSYWENGKETTRLKLSEMEKEQIEKYVKEMQTNDAEERRSMVQEGVLPKKRNSTNRRPTAIQAMGQQLAYKAQLEVAVTQNNETGTFGQIDKMSSPNSNCS